MGELIEFNDTLKLTTEQGFPEDVLDLERHHRKPIMLADVQDHVFEFEKLGLRLYHHTPTRCFLVHEIQGKWIFWGHVELFEQTITGEKANMYRTRGKYRIIEIYDPHYQEIVTNRESREGRSYFITS